MSPKKSPKEVEIYNRYKKWLSSSEPIPLHVIENYKLELKNLKP
jgi:hypothetical protein